MMIINTLALMFGYIALGFIALMFVLFALTWVYILTENVLRLIRYKRVLGVVRGAYRRSVYVVATECLNFLTEAGVPKGVTLYDAYEIIKRYKDEK